MISERLLRISYLVYYFERLYRSRSGHAISLRLATIPYQPTAVLLAILPHHRICKYGEGLFAEQNNASFLEQTSFVESIDGLPIYWQNFCHLSDAINTSRLYLHN
jgi:hypothetical protein